MNRLQETHGAAGSQESVRQAALVPGNRQNWSAHDRDIN